MATYVPAPLFKYGLNMSSGDKLNTYAAGTSTPLAVHTNSTGTAATNPVVADSRGEADVWLEAGVAYKFIHTTSADVTISTVDGVIALVGYSINTSTTPASLFQGPNQFPQWLSFAIGDQDNAFTTGTEKFVKYFHRACTLHAVGGGVKTSTGVSSVKMDINVNTSSVFSTQVICINASSYTTNNASSAPVLSITSLPANARIGFDIDQTGAGAIGPVVDMLVTWTS